MKKYKVIKPYVDKLTLEMHERGEVVELDDGRAKELTDVVEELKPANDGGKDAKGSKK